MEWRVNVYIDYREKYIKEYFEKNREYDSIVSVKNLEIGDVVILDTLMMNPPFLKEKQLKIWHHLYKMEDL